MPNRPFTFMSTPAIRPPARDDAAALASLMGELGYPVSPQVLWSRIDAMASPSHCTLVAEVDGKVAGFVGCSALAIYESDIPTCWIMALAVASPFRRHGVGRALLQAVERWCAHRGIPDIRLHSGEARAEAHGFYEACGFSRAGARFKKALAPDAGPRERQSPDWHLPRSK
jgi:GNAT superfamily N-acetyltransferase